MRGIGLESVLSGILVVRFIAVGSKDLLESLSMAPLTGHVRNALAGFGICVLLSTTAFAQGSNAPPFSGIYKKPVLSPYTAMGFAAANQAAGVASPSASLDAYQNTVLPRLELERQGIQQINQSRQISGLGGKVRAIQNQQFRESNIRATGHSATFQNTSHFFPGR